MRNGVAFAVALAILFYLWTLNYNKLGSFYDYSIMADAAGKYAAGMRPFRDFTSSLQSLPIWLAHGCELLFGPRYLSLAYGNLLLSLGLFSVIVQYARKAFPFSVALLIGMAITIASALQHGILWYNSIALLLLSAISLKCADMLRARAVALRDAVCVAALLLLIGMTKLNFFAIAIGVAGFLALVGMISGPSIRSGKKIVALTGLAVSACAAPPFIESFANHASLSTWVREVIVTPSARAQGLSSILNPVFYLSEWNRYYPGTLLKGAVLFCLLVYGFIAKATIKRFRSGRDPVLQLLIARLGMIILFWGSTTLLVLTNFEIESLCLCFCLIGVCVMQLSGHFPGESWEKMLRGSAIVLAAYFLLVGSVSLSRHSRISYTGNFFPDGSTPSSDVPAYLRGVVLSPQAVLRLSSLGDLLKKNEGVNVYWGPGLEIVNRIHAGVTDPTFPLWYHRDVTVRDVDGKPIKDAIQRSRAEVVVVDQEWFFEFPDALMREMNHKWGLESQEGPLLIYRVKNVASERTGIHGNP